MSVTVVIASIPSRAAMLAEALTSVTQQTVLPTRIHVEIDHQRVGAAATRNRALETVQTEWVAFLDDDDVLGEFHLETLLDCSQGADVVYPWFDLDVGGVLVEEDPLAAPYDGQLASPYGQPFGDEQRQHLLHHANFVPVTALVRMSLIRQVGGFPQPGTTQWPNPACEDWGLWTRLLRAGAVFRHAPYRTWTWRHHGANTSGVGSS